MQQSPFLGILMIFPLLQLTQRDELVTKIKKIADNPLKNPRKQADEIHKVQAQWQALDQTSKTASQKQWNIFNLILIKHGYPANSSTNSINKSWLMQQKNSR